MDSLMVTTKVLLQGESRSIGTRLNITLKATFVRSHVLAVNSSELNSYATVDLAEQKEMTYFKSQRRWKVFEQ